MSSLRHLVINSMYILVSFIPVWLWLISTSCGYTFARKGKISASKMQHETYMRNSTWNGDRKVVVIRGKMHWHSQIFLVTWPRDTIWLASVLLPDYQMWGRAVENRRSTSTRVQLKITFLDKKLGWLLVNPCFPYDKLPSSLAEIFCRQIKSLAFPDYQRLGCFLSCDLFHC